ncbi:hypothetical protein [Archangium sp.]|uniref:hypothetical protein n=1 Tax=Archangium sp. TaxID=1872627 RepID=UPI002ED9E5F8
MFASFSRVLGVSIVALFLAACSQSARSTPPTEAEVKAYVTRKAQALATGVGSSHSSTTVTFESVTFGESRETTERDRLVNGISGPMVFPVRVKYSELRRWGNGDTQTVQTHYAYEFYVDEFGEWNAYGVGPVN